MSNSTFNTRIGPIHPALKEPIQFMFEIEGEKVVKADFAPGHAHRTRCKDAERDNKEQPPPPSEPDEKGEDEKEHI